MSRANSPNGLSKFGVSIIDTPYRYGYNIVVKGVESAGKGFMI